MTLIVVAHGVGKHEENFHQAWEAILRANHPNRDFEVKGLWWDGVLRQIAERYPVLSTEFADALAGLGLPQIKRLSRSSAFQKFYPILQETLMDVLVYCALGDMRELIFSTCSPQLLSMTEGRRSETILIGHSLGAALMPHLVQYQRADAGGIPYRAMFLLASPLGIRSPVPGVVPDPLMVTPGCDGLGRTDVLLEMSSTWADAGEDRLRFVINRGDPICSDVQVTSRSLTFDPVPLQQGFSNEEREALQEDNPNCLIEFGDGTAKVDDLLANHAVEGYLNRQEFNDALSPLL